MHLPQNLLIIGASARAAAFSALRAGLRPWCMDLFGDADLLARCLAYRLPAGEYPHGFEEAARHDIPGPWLYTGGLENRPGLVQRFAGLRPLWGNGRDALMLARAPEHIATLLEQADLPCPAVRRKGDARPPGRWLMKPLAGSGGVGIQFLEGDLPDARPRCYVQQFIEGDSCAAVYLGDGQHSQLLGVTRQLVGTSWLHARPFRYCGSIGPLALEPPLRERFDRLGAVLTSGCDMRGLFGVDCVLRDGIPWPVEINPRYTASVEVLEYAQGISSLALHRQVFEPPTENAAVVAAPAAGSCVGKAILFAQAALTFPDDGPWLAALHAPDSVGELPAFADIPFAGTRIEAGRPILTLFARADSPVGCLDVLQQTAADLDHRLFGR